MKLPNNKVLIEVSYDDSADAILAINSVNTILTVGNPEHYRKWNNLHSCLPGNAGQRKVIGRFKIETLSSD